MLPNTKEENNKFCWWLHWHTAGNQFIILMHLISLEKKQNGYINAKQGNKSNKDNVSQGVLD